MWHRREAPTAPIRVPLRALAMTPTEPLVPPQASPVPATGPRCRASAGKLEGEKAEATAGAQGTAAASGKTEPSRAVTGLHTRQGRKLFCLKAAPGGPPGRSPALLVPASPGGQGGSEKRAPRRGQSQVEEALVQSVGSSHYTILIWGPSGKTMLPAAQQKVEETNKVRLFYLQLTETFAPDPKSESSSIHPHHSWG